MRANSADDVNDKGSASPTWRANSLEDLCADWAPLLSGTSTLELTVQLPRLGLLRLSVREYKTGLWYLHLRSAYASSCRHLEGSRERYTQLFARALNGQVDLEISRDPS
ncbi:hypothetical protein C4K03_4736 [Pseudomonas synxantha]|uniref:Type III secretion protein HrpP n=1 Tax=Pseudomonas synxantha TaxID=47883 RepID=A0A3G7UBW4_9PSED|nr:hypothetical protein C4K03_4736 [Pseudomonas synxantha]